MERLPRFIVIWKDIQEDKICRTRTEESSESTVKLMYGTEKWGVKLLYLFRVKTLKYGSMSVPLLHK